MNRRQIFVQLAVSHLHEWVARDGRVWVFLLVRLSLDGRPVLKPFVVLACEDDA